jgi:transketolase
MRDNFIKKLIEIAKKDPRVVLLTADLGFSVLEEFANEFPSRFFNVGVSEQNMIGIATGLAESGFIPFTYSIAPFSLLRPYEFIKNGPILHNLPVRIIAIGPGFEYGNLGATHHLIEDIAVTRIFPNLSIYSPINSKNAESILDKSYLENNPIYYRIGKNKDSLSDNLDYVESDNFIQLSKGDDSVAVFGIGSIVEEILKCNNVIDKKISSYAITKIDQKIQKELIAIIQKYKNIISVEAHYINGGIGSMIAEIIAENQLPMKLHRLGVKKTTDGIFGDSNFMHRKHNISSLDILNVVEKII